MQKILQIVFLVLCGQLSELAVSKSIENNDVQDIDKNSGVSIDAPEQIIVDVLGTNSYGGVPGPIGGSKSRTSVVNGGLSDRSEGVSIKDESDSDTYERKDERFSDVSHESGFNRGFKATPDDARCSELRSILLNSGGITKGQTVDYCETPSCDFLIVSPCTDASGDKQKPEDIETEHDSEKSNVDEVCVELQGIQAKKHRQLSKGQLLDYCEHACTYNRYVMCDDIEAHHELGGITWLNRTLMGFVNRDFGKRNDYSVMWSMNRESYFDILWFLAPIASTFIPIIASGSSWYMTSKFIIFVYGFLAAFLMRSNMTQAMNAVVISFICLLGNMRSHAATDYVTSYIAIVVQIVFAVTTDHFMANLGMGIVVVIVHGMQLHGLIKNKAVHNKLFAFFHILQMLVSIDLSNRIIEGLQFNVIGLRVVRSLWGASLPLGEYHMLTTNILSESRKFLYDVPAAGVLPMILASMLGYVISFCGFRIVLGAWLIQGANKKKDVGNPIIAFGTYCVDIWEPMRFMIGVAFNENKLSGQRCWYSLLACILMLFEIFYAFDFFVVRVFLSIAACLLGSEYFALSVRLSIVVLTSSEAISEGTKTDKLAYSHAKAVSAIDAANLNRLSSFVVKIFVLRADGTWGEGKGFLSLEQGTVYLNTVLHVVEPGSIMRILWRDQVIQLSIADVFMSCGPGVDPAVRMTHPFITKIGGADINLMPPSQKPYINMCWLLNDQSVIVPIYAFAWGPPFTLAVAAEHGDSGSAIIGTDTNGESHLLGAVSRAPIGGFSGVYASMHGSPLEGFTSAIGNVPEVTEEQLAAVEEINSYILESALFAIENGGGSDVEIDENAVKVDDLEVPESLITSSECVSSTSAELDGDFVRGFDDEEEEEAYDDDWERGPGERDGDESRNQRRQKKIKNERKNAAARKRNLCSVQVINELTADVFKDNPESRRAAAEAVSKAKVLKFNLERAEATRVAKARFPVGTMDGHAGGLTRGAMVRAGLGLNPGRGNAYNDKGVGIPSPEKGKGKGKGARAVVPPEPTTVAKPTIAAKPKLKVVATSPAEQPAKKRKPKGKTSVVQEADASAQAKNPKGIGAAGAKASGKGEGKTRLSANAPAWTEGDDLPPEPGASSFDAVD